MIVVKDHLEVAGLDINIVHWKLPLVSCHFGMSLWIAQCQA
jgi:hypothetical protein